MTVEAARTVGPVTVALRCAGPVLLELALTPDRGVQPWVASIRTASHRADGWARQPWRPAPDGAGWTIPASCVFGTIVEFGADRTTGRRRHRRTVRWYGIAVAHEPDWLILHGPHPHPANAEHQAARWLTAAKAYAITLDDPCADHTSPDDPRSRRPAITAARQGH